MTDQLISYTTSGATPTLTRRRDRRAATGRSVCVCRLRRGAGIPLSQRACSLLSPARHTPAGTHLQGRNVAGAVRYAVRLREICPAGRRRGLAFAGDREVADRSGRCAAAPRRQRAATSYFAEVLAAKASLESEADTEAAEEVPEGEKKVRSPPCSPRRCSASIRRIPVRRCMPI